MKKSALTVVLCASFVAAIFLAGCKGSETAQTGAISKEPVKTSGKKPDWVADDKTYMVEDQKMYFRVMSDNESDLTFALRGLDGQAYASLINAVKIRAGLEFDEAVTGSKYNTNSIGQARQYVVNAIGDIKVSGLTKEREYWEQFEKTEGAGKVAYINTVYGFYSIPEQEMARAKDEAWNKAEQTAERQADKEAKQLLQETKSRFLSREP
jgi:hypothetical protein